MKRRAILFSLALLALPACEAGKTVRFGAVLPLTGDFQLYGQAIRKGVELAYEEVKADPAYPFEIEVSIVDSQGDPDRAAELLAEEYSAGAVAVIGGVVTTEALQMVPVADKYDRILVSPSASNPQLTGISKNFYRVFPSDSREGTTMGNFASRKLGVEDVVILTKEDPYAKGIQEVFSTEFERNGGKVTEVIEYPPGAADFSGFIERVMTVSPQGVYVAAYADDVGKMIEELRERGYKGTIMTTAAFASPEAIERVGQAAEGVFLTQAVFDIGSEDPKIAAFVEAYRAKNGLSPDLYAAHGYDAMMVLAECLKTSGPFASDFWKGIRSIQDFQGVTGTIQFDERGDVQKFPRVYAIDAGNLIDYERETERRRKELIERLRKLEEAQRRQVGG